MATLNGSIDPHLERQIAQAGDKGEVEAVLLVRKASSAKTVQFGMQEDAPEDGGNVGEALVNSVSAQLKEKPSEVRYLPNLGVIVVKGSGNLVRHLVDSEEVLSAMSSESGEVYPAENAKN